MARMAEHLGTLIAEAAADPDRPLGRIPLTLDEEERELASPFREDF